jgi:peptide deformylase
LRAYAPLFFSPSDEKECMSMIKILQYPDKRLQRIAVPVTTFDHTIQQVIDDMFETHYGTAHCAALAATQLDLDPAWRITVIDFSEQKNQPLCLVNPVIIHSEGEQIEEEGCMSVYPDAIFEKVKRAMSIVVKAQDRHGNPLEIPADGYFAKCMQHEIDHLDGKIFLNRLNSVKLERVQRKIKKYIRFSKNKF